MKVRMYLGQTVDNAVSILRHTVTYLQSAIVMHLSHARKTVRTHTQLYVYVCVTMYIYQYTLNYSVKEILKHFH